MCIQRGPIASYGISVSNFDGLARKHAIDGLLEGEVGRLAHELPQRAAHELLRCLAEARRVALVGPDEPPLAVAAGDDRRGGVHHELQVLARLPDLPLSRLALGDVLAGAEHADRPAGGIALESGSSCGSSARRRSAGGAGIPSRTVRRALETGCSRTARMASRSSGWTNVSKKIARETSISPGSCPKIRYISSDQRNEEAAAVASPSFRVSSQLPTCAVDCDCSSMCWRSGATPPRRA